ncbi:hypothetical protein ACSQ67_014511 [Phaseolus vulgaris]
MLADLGCLTELRTLVREPVPPVGIISLGTGNDLSRSFNWGGSFPFAWRFAIKRTLQMTSIGTVKRWVISVCMELASFPCNAKRHICETTALFVACNS